MSRVGLLWRSFNDGKHNPLRSSELKFYQLFKDFLRFRSNLGFFFLILGGNYWEKRRRIDDKISLVCQSPDPF